ncbi:MAG TPA: hypothetical protein VHX12_11590 [Acidisoma sp.]|nr:hypothetical protein [Acidisoma sp.]
MSDQAQGDDWLHLLPGAPQSDRAVIAFAGVQTRLGGIDLKEFSNSLAGGRQKQRHIAFVRESPARWYNTIDLSALAAFAAAQRERHIVTLGNSMGGFAAILFSLILPGVRGSISFCPQFSVHPDEVPFERRWNEYVSAVAEWRYRTCLPVAWNHPKGVSHTLFCGSGVPSDIRHAELIVQSARNSAAAFILEGCGHDVARHLKSRDLLLPLLDLLIEGTGTVAAVAGLLQSQGIRFRQVGP